MTSQLHNLRKDTGNIIKMNKKAFEALKNVGQVYIYGLSFSPVDEPYLDEVLSKVNKETTKWTVSYYSPDDKEKAKQYFGKKGIKEDLVGFIKLEDLTLLKQMEIHFE